MTPQNMSQFASMKEFIPYFKEAFDLSAAASDAIYSTTQTITGGLIVCKDFVVATGVTLTVSNPLTVICQSFTNNGTITTTGVTEMVLNKFRYSNVERVPERQNLQDVSQGASPGSLGGLGGSNYGSGHATGPTYEARWEGALQSGTYGTWIRRVNKGWLQLPAVGLWWPIALFRNPLLSQGGCPDINFRGVCASLYYQHAGNDGTYSGAGLNITGGPAGSTVEVFSKGAVINAVGAIITCNGVMGSYTGGAEYGGSGAGGNIGLFSLTSISQLGTMNCNGAAGLSGTYTGYSASGGGGGGGIFFNAPVVTNTGTNTVTVGTVGLSGSDGLVMTETYSRLWRVNLPDTLLGI